MDQRERPRGERDRTGSSRDRQPMPDIGRGSLRLERLQLEADGDALIELAELGAFEQFVQVQLTDENDLEELLLVGLEV